MNEPEPFDHSSEPASGPRPDCFGDGDLVCPQDEDGIMHPRQECLPCGHLRACLQLALHRRGKLRLVEEPAPSKVTGFFKRWSDRKLSKQKES